MSESYRVYTSSEGFEMLVGRNARDNDRLSLKVGRPHDFWFHVAATSGSHVVVRNPDRLKRLPRATLREAAALSAYFSKSREGGRVDVHWTTCQHVRKARGAPPGQVQLAQYDTVKVSPRRDLPSGVEEG